MAKKFLIVDGEIRMSSSIEYHRELLPSKKPDAIVSGGGRFEIFDDKKQVLMYGSSDEFGKAKKGDILSALEQSLLSPSLDTYLFYISDYEWSGDAIKELNDRDTPDWVYNF